MNTDSHFQQRELYVFRTKRDGTNFTLFKYFSPTKLADLLRCRVSLTPPKYLNDPFEFAVSREPPDKKEWEQLFDRFVTDQYEGFPAEYKAATSFATFKEDKDTMRAAWVSRVMSQEFRDAEPHVMQEQLSRLFGVVCFAEVHDNLLMWSHYTDSYRGFVAEFICDWEHVRHVPQARGTPFGIGFKVEYSTNFPLLRSDFSNPVQSFCTKKPEWSYEQEWRVIRLLATSDFIEDQKGHRFVCFPPLSLRRIICGYRMPNTDKDRIAALMGNSDHRHVQVQTAHPNLNTQTVVFRDFV